MVFDIKAYMNEKSAIIESFLESYFEKPSDPLILFESMKYSLFAGGKRVRPILVIASYEACGGKAQHIIPQAASLELIHTYSLIHDDLPSMDNDDLRRGKPTNHKVYGEAFAILAGDALLTEAFRMMTIYDHRVINGTALIRTVQEISSAAGAGGMVGGQVQDIISEKAEPNIDMVHFIHTRKTASLISACLKSGALLAGAEEKKYKALTVYGDHMGLVFQIVDDILDVEGKTEDLGKRSGADQNRNKMTYPAVIGIEKARKEVQMLVEEAIRSLQIFSSEADPLRELATYLMSRRN